MWNEIEKILKEKHMSIYRLAKESGVNENTLRNYKKNYSNADGVDPSFKNICKIADALNVSLDDLRDKER
ncbi:helix-turn-helix domain-containing protein [Lactobacillus gasseri]|nr:MAG: helix-turn-helix domain protein [Bacteriophage sp.]UYP71307.1 helix-turn-helix domain-containing protein [Lactobacillus gasseri]